MRVVIDTNVVISAVLKNRAPEEVILFIVHHPEFEWIASQEIINEYIDVLQRKKFNLPESLLDQWISMFQSIVTVTDNPRDIAFPRDEKDSKFLSCAMNSNADFFITGDKDFEGLKKIGNTVIISVSLFIKNICNKW